jgi:hypothetical protein
MAYGDPTLDAIMESLRASEGAPQQNRPQFRITQSSSVLPNVASAPEAAAGVPFYNRPLTFRGLARGAFRGAVRASPYTLALPSIIEAAQMTGGIVRGEQAATPENRPARAFNILTGGLFNPAARTASPLSTPPATPISAVPDQPDAFSGVPQDMTPIRTDLNAEQILQENYAPARGTGAIRLGNGPARVIDSRTSPEFVAGQVPTAAPSTTGNYAGDFTGALLNLKQISGDNAQRVAQAKAAAADLAARGTVARGVAALQTSELSARLAAEHLRANPGDIAGAAAVLHGRSQGGGGDKVFFPGLGPQDPTLVGNKRTGAVISRKPTPAVTEAAIQEDMRAKKLTRAAVLAEYQRRGYDTTGFQ